jgi:ribosomal protein S18 acetylase RimI-like enzyme
MMPPGYVIGPARMDDLPAIMRLERAGFAPAIVERESVFAARLATFPEGLLLLRDAATGGACGYIAMERWACDPGVEPAAYALGHDPAPRYSPSGTVLYTASMAIAPALRGLGLGAGFFRETRALVLRKAPEIDLELLIVRESWRGARRIYESAGFRVRATIPGLFPTAPMGRGDGLATDDGAGTAAVLMELRISGGNLPEAISEKPGPDGAFAPSETFRWAPRPCRRA